MGCTACTVRRILSSNFCALCIVDHTVAVRRCHLGTLVVKARHQCKDRHNIHIERAEAYLGSFTVTTRYAMCSALMIFRTEFLARKKPFGMSNTTIAILAELLATTGKDVRKRTQEHLATEGRENRTYAKISELRILADSKQRAGQAQGQTERGR